MQVSNNQTITVEVEPIVAISASKRRIEVSLNQGVNYGTLQINFGEGEVFVFLNMMAELRDIVRKSPRILEKDWNSERVYRNSEHGVFDWVKEEVPEPSE